MRRKKKGKIQWKKIRDLKKTQNCPGKKEEKSIKKSNFRKTMQKKILKGPKMKNVGNRERKIIKNVKNEWVNGCGSEEPLWRSTVCVGAHPLGTIFPSMSK